MPKSRNRSRDIRKRAAKKRANKLYQERKILKDREKTAKLFELGTIVPADGVSHDD